MEGRKGWSMQIYCSVFVTIVEKESQVFFNIPYKRLKRIKFLFKTTASSFSQGWLKIREFAFSSGVCDNVWSVFWNFFTWKGFPEPTKPLVSGWTILSGLIRISLPCGSSTCFLTQRFKSSGYHSWVLQNGLIRIRRGTHSSFIFRSTPERENPYERPIFQFCINIYFLWL